MKKKMLPALLALVFILLAAPGSYAQKGKGKKDKKKTESTEPVQPVNDTPPWAPANAAYNESYTRYFDLIHTSLQVSFDWQQRRMPGKAQLKLVPHFYAQDTLVLDAKGFDIKSVGQLSGPGGAVAALKYSYNGRKLRIALPKAYTRTDTFTVAIDYVAKPDELPQEGSDAIMSDKGLYFINADGKLPGKPRQIWTQGETEASSCWFPTIDAPNERCTQDVAITVDKLYQTLSNGVLKTSTPNADGTRTDLWVMDKPHAPYLFMMAVGEFSVIKDSWNGMEVSYYVEPRLASYARQCFGNTPEMIDFYSKKMGVPYPWSKYSQVAVRDFVSGAMENTTATIHMEQVAHDSRSHLDDPMEDIIAHELFHHWFGDLVTCESWSNLPLNESFATYGEYLWREHKYGAWHAESLRESELNGYLSESVNKREPLIRFRYASREDMFDAHSYQKGGCILHLLRKTVGDDAFFAALKQYLTRNAYTDVEIHELRIALEDITGKDLNWFFEQWFFKPGHPELRENYSWNASTSTLSLNLKQVQDLRYMPTYRLPARVLVMYPGGKSETFQIEFNTLDTIWTWKLAQAPADVIFDEDKAIPTRSQKDKPLSWWLYQAQNGKTYMQVSEALGQLSRRLEDPAAYNTIVALTKHEYAGLRQKAIDLLAGRKDNLTAEVLTSLENIFATDKSAPVRRSALELLQRSKLPAEKLNSLYDAAVKDSSYAIFTIGLNGIYKTDKAKGLAIAKTAKTWLSDDVQEAICKILIAEKDAEALDHTLSVLPNMPLGYPKMFLIMGLGDYVKELGSEPDKQNRGIDYLMAEARFNNTWFLRLNAAKALNKMKDNPRVKAFLEELKQTETNTQLKQIYENML